MFELTAIAAAITIASSVYQYMLYFVIPAGLLRILLSLVPIAVFLYIVTSPIGKEFVMSLAKDFKEDLIEGGKPAAYLDAFGIMVVFVIGNIGWWVIRAAGRGESFTNGLLMGSLFSIIAMS
jgi:hypothetical protein